MPRGNGGAFESDIAVERELPCRLTDDELRMRGDAMAEAELVVDTLKDERRALNKKIFANTDERNRLAHIIDSETEPRMVVCKWVASFEENVYRLVRQDTGDIVEQRPMSVADRQGALPYPPDDGGDGAAGEGSGPGDTDDGVDGDDDTDDDAQVDGYAAEREVEAVDVTDDDEPPAKKKRARPRATFTKAKRVRSPHTRKAAKRARG